jgi:CBS domain containing-hemolysin-like protein
VAYAFNQYHLISAPVVDEDGRLIGVITIDDAMAVLDEEHEEDILRLAGVGEGSLSDRVMNTTKQRLPWLAVNLVTAIAASLVIAQFEVALAQIVALAVLMPIVASMGGNAGTQTMTVAVRAIATRELTASNALRAAVTGVRPANWSSSARNRRGRQMWRIKAFLRRSEVSNPSTTAINKPISPVVARTGRSPKAPEISAKTSASLAAGSSRSNTS